MHQTMLLSSTYVSNIHWKYRGCEVCCGLCVQYICIQDKYVLCGCTSVCNPKHKSVCVEKKRQIAWNLLPGPGKRVLRSYIEKFALKIPFDFHNWWVLLWRGGSPVYFLEISKNTRFLARLASFGWGLKWQSIEMCLRSNVWMRFITECIVRTSDR